MLDHSPYESSSQALRGLVNVKGLRYRKISSVKNNFTNVMGCIDEVLALAIISQFVSTLGRNSVIVRDAIVKCILVLS
jgi:hypothetical protein